VLHRLLEQQAIVSMRQLSRARVDVQNLASALSQQQGSMQGLAQEFSQQRIEALATLQQLQQSIDQLARRGFWSWLRRLIKRGH